MVRQTASTRADYSAFSTLTTRWADNDIYGHMNNAVHYQMFDTAVNSYLLENGALDLKLGTTVFLVVETGCQYFSELAFPDRICAGIKVRTLGRSSVTYNVGLFRGEDNIAAAQGHFVHVNVDRVTRRPAQIQMKKKLVLKKIMI
jgi:acyl-CoA thioester hydrolase|tara:strand:- start:119 stop:553 length:435 start_codon:yes stop_codon:yes gene_type:complete